MTVIDHTAVGSRTALITDLVVHPANKRELGDITGLTESIRSLGVLMPLLVEPTASGYRVLAGKRRLAAAVAAGLEAVPIHVQADDDVVLMAMAAENLSRKDLTMAEEAETYLQLEAEGFDVATIAVGTGRTAEHVKMGLRVAGAKAPAKKVIADRPVTLEQAAAIAEFEDDEAAIEELLDTMEFEPDQLDHQLSRLRLEAASQAAVVAKAQELAAGGATVLDGPPGWSNLQEPCRISELYAEGSTTSLSIEDHAACPGAAVFVEKTWRGDPAVVHACADPAGNGHKLVNGRTRGRSDAAAKSTDLSDKEREKASAARKAVIANNKAWRAAMPVRVAFVEQVIARRSPPKGTLRFAVERITSRPYAISHVGAHSGELLPKGFDLEQLAAKRTDAQLPLALFAMVARSIEAQLANYARPHECKEPEVRAYFEFLRAAGYTLAPVEELIVPAPKPAKVTPAKKAPRKAAAK